MRLKGPSPEVRAALEKRGLEDVLEPAFRSGPRAAASLAAELEALDWKMLDRQRSRLGVPAGKPPEGLEPPPLAPPSTAGGLAVASPALEAGWEALRAGRVAVVTVAGGQASRLGFQGPKGAFPLGPVTGASLFQILAGKVRRLGELAACPLPWILQTGPGNHSETQAFFERRNFFGLPIRDLRFVCQGTFPALSPQGGLLLASPGSLFRNPDGHGGCFRALYRSGTLDWLRERGVSQVYYCQVDNPLARVGDPAFLGRHVLAHADMSVKVVEKIDPGEKVGLVVRREGRTLCIEYSDLDPRLGALRDPDGGLRFRAGNIAIHVFDLDFLERMATGGGLPLHLARKKVLALGEGLEPEIREGIKFEQFVFDALPQARTVVVQLCERAEEFAPVKNRHGIDSIDTSQGALRAQAARWAAGLFPAQEGSSANEPWEIRPGVAWGPEDLRTRKPLLRRTFGGRLLVLQRSVDP
ncbi:MAG: UTP--glucose-1-phosphate uridylyltransferase [Planctomycetota bacterium]